MTNLETLLQNLKCIFGFHVFFHKKEVVMYSCCDHHLKCKHCKYEIVYTYRTWNKSEADKDYFT